MCQRRAHSFGQTQKLDTKEAIKEIYAPVDLLWTWLKDRELTSSQDWEIWERCVFIYERLIAGVSFSFQENFRKNWNARNLRGGDGGGGDNARPELITPPHLLKPLWNSPRLANPGHTLTCFGLEVYTCVSEHFLTYQFSCPNMLSQFLYMTLAMLWNKSEDQPETVIPNVALSARMKIHSENETMRWDGEEQGVGDRGWDSIMRCDHC